MIEIYRTATGYFWRTLPILLATSLGLYLAALALAFVFASAMMPERGALTSPRYEDVQEVAGVLFIAAPAIYLVLLSLFGMALPALVARNRAYRLTTGLKASPRIALGLILGPGLTGGLLLALTLLFVAWFGDLPDHSPFGQWVLGTLMTTLGFLPTILAVAVLCQAYRRAYPHEG